MSLPMLNQTGGTPQPLQAKFPHESGVSLRLQCFVLPRDGEGRIAVQRIQGIDGWCLSGEMLLINEAPDAAAQRVVRSWYASPMETRLARVLNFPAMGNGDTKWYVVFVYEAQAPADLKRTPDCEALEFRALDDPPAPWGLSHEDIWRGLGGK